MISDTVVAPATPYGIGGIAVVRISGAQSTAVLDKLLNNNGLLRPLKPRHSTLAHIFDENGTIIDESLIVYYKAPNSYTGEDLIEISCHGSPTLVDRVVATCCSFGARIAEPGEFTQRAFINGKMDLVQAESVASLISSQSIEGSKLSLRLLDGELSEKLTTIYKNIVHAASLVEFELDISEDELQPNLKIEVKKTIEKQLLQIKELLASYKQARLLNNGALVVIAGAPNVGKSTLLNTLSKSDRAITSATPGTTRDTIDVPLIISGVPIKLVDTAGIREVEEYVEGEGVRRSLDILKKADLILLIRDFAHENSPLTNVPAKIPIINILNKSDLLSSAEARELQRSQNSPLLISAKKGINIGNLKTAIKEQLGINSSISDILSITTGRQQQALLLCRDNLIRAAGLLNNPRCAYELVSIDLRNALDAIGEILGKATPDDILNNIFDQFCVGK